MTAGQRLDWTSVWQDLPAEKGSYLLCIHLQEAAPAPPKFNDNFQPGLYLYAGSANGPGGIQARCGRHLRRNKSRKWHIDWLTKAATDIQVLPFLDHSECQVMELLLDIPETHIPFRRFGSSDCRGCPAHLTLCLDSHSITQLKSRLLSVSLHKNVSPHGTQST